MRGNVSMLAAKYSLTAAATYKCSSETIAKTVENKDHATAAHKSTDILLTNSTQCLEGDNQLRQTF